MYVEKYYCTSSFPNQYQESISLKFSTCTNKKRMIKEKKDLKAQTEVQLHLQPSQKLKVQPKPFLFSKKNKNKNKRCKRQKPILLPKIIIIIIIM